MEEYNKYINKLAVIRNCVSLICCTILAIAFNKWWLIFIAVLFTSFVENVDEGDKKCTKN
jgi:hypothetical protein